MGQKINFAAEAAGKLPAHCFRRKPVAGMGAAQAQLSRRWHCATGQGAGSRAAALQGPEMTVVQPVRDPACSSH